MVGIRSFPFEIVYFLGVRSVFLGECTSFTHLEQWVMNGKQGSEIHLSSLRYIGLGLWSDFIKLFIKGLVVSWPAYYLSTGSWWLKKSEKTCLGCLYKGWKSIQLYGDYSKPRIYPQPSSSHQDDITFLFGNPNLNLHLLLESWVGGRPEIYHLIRIPGSRHPAICVQVEALKMINSLMLVLQHCNSVVSNFREGVVVIQKWFWGIPGKHCVPFFKGNCGWF